MCMLQPNSRNMNNNICVFTCILFLVSCEAGINCFCEKLTEGASYIAMLSIGSFLAWAMCTSKGTKVATIQPMYFSCINEHGKKLI